MAAATLAAALRTADRAAVCAGDFTGDIAELERRLRVGEERLGDENDLGAITRRPDKVFLGEVDF